MNFYFYIVTFLVYIFVFKVSASERYICNHSKDNSIQLITNFYILGDKLIMSGSSGNGEYKVVNRSKNGLLALNSSFIGNEFGLETILINKKDKIFIYKTYINSESHNNILKIKGVCNFTN